jgi:hypothetical protein
MSLVRIFCLSWTPKNHIMCWKTFSSRPRIAPTGDTGGALTLARHHPPFKPSAAPPAERATGATRAARWDGSSGRSPLIGHNVVGIPAPSSRLQAQRVGF